MAFARLSRRTTDHILRSRPDPLDILKTTALVTLHMQHVKIDLRRIRSIARVLSLRPLAVPEWNYEYHFHDGTERTVLYIFLLDALNFSFWGTPRWSVTYHGARLDGYWALAASLKRAIEENADILDASYLSSISPTELAGVLRGRGEIPMFVERWRNVRELGQVLCERFGGSAARMVEGAREDASRLARMVADNLSSFRDSTIYGSYPVNFFKRAQILVGDIAGSFGGKEWGVFKNLGDLTAFADYKLPQILRAWGILQYEPGLARRIQAKRLILKDSKEETEIRAATLWAVELMRAAMSTFGRELKSTELDWFLWNASQENTHGMQPYHLVRTIYY